MHQEELNHPPSAGGTVEMSRQIAVASPPAAYLFKTHDGTYGIMQIEESTEEPRGARVRGTNSLRQTTAARSPANPRLSRENLTRRMEAAAMISDQEQKSQALSATAIDAAKSGEVEIARRSLQQMSAKHWKDDAAAQAARSLSKRGVRKQAFEIAREIADLETRNQTLVELAADAASAGDAGAAKTSAPVI